MSVVLGSGDFCFDFLQGIYGVFYFSTFSVILCSGDFDFSLGSGDFYLSFSVTRGLDLLAGSLLFNRLT